MPDSPRPRNPDKSPPPPARRSDARQIRLQPRDVIGLVTLADMYAAPYDLIGARLSLNDRGVRAIVGRWRDAGLAYTGKIAEGPHWCWLSPAGMRQVGHMWEAAPPPLARLAHIRAVLAARIWLEESAEWKAGQALWRCERRLRSERPGVGQPGHVADGEIIWPSIPGSRSAGETWAVEVELTPKTQARVQRILAGLLAQPYAHVLYLCEPAAHPVVTRAAATFRPQQAERVIIRHLPRDAAAPEAR